MTKQPSALRHVGATARRTVESWHNLTRCGLSSHSFLPVLRAGCSRRSVLVCLASLTAVQCGEQENTLELSEVSSVALPSGFRPDRVVFGEAGEVAVLSVQPAAVALVNGMDVTIMSLNNSIRPIGLRIADARAAAIEILDADVPTVRRYVHGVLLEERLLQAPVELVHAVPAPGGWFVAGVGDGDLELYWLRGDRWQYLTAISLEGSDPDMYHLGATGGQAVLTSSQPPFRIVVIDTSAFVVFHRLANEAVPKALSAIASPYGFPAVLLDDRVIQTIADLRNDSYRVAVYNSSGFIRASALPAPMVLLGSMSARKELFAARNLGGQTEVVVYGWRWSAARSMFSLLTKGG